MTAIRKFVLFAVGAFVLIASEGWCFICVDEIGRWPYGPPWAMTPHGSHLVFGSGATVQIAEVNANGALEVVGETTLRTTPTAMTTTGDLLLAADRDGLHVVDLSDPHSPVEQGFLALDRRISDIEVSGTTAFVIGREAVHVVDVSSPESPRRVAVNTFGADFLIAAAIQGDNLYLLQVNRFRVVNISSPDRPIVVGTLFTGTAGDDVVVHDDHAYISGRSRPLSVVDVGDPSSPTVVADLPEARALWTEDGLLLAAAGSVLRVYDLIDPSEPRLTGSITGSGRREAVAVTFAGGAVFVADIILPGLRSFGLDGSMAPVETAVTEHFGPAGAIEVTGSGERAFVAADGLVELDFSYPAQPVLAGRLADGGPDYISDMALSGNLLFATDSGGGVWLFDVSTPGEPRRVGRTQGPFGLIPVIVAAGAFAYASDGETLRVYDATVPDEWTEVGRLELEWNWWAELAAVGETVFLSDSSGLRIIDVADPSLPVEVGFAPIPGQSGGVAVEGRLAFVNINGISPGVNGLVVFNVANRAEPLELGRWVTDKFLSDVVVSGDEVLVTGGGAAVTVIDVSDPNHPRRVGRSRPLLTGDYGDDISGTTPHAVVTLGWAGLTVFETSPCAPRRPTGRIPAS